MKIEQEQLAEEAIRRESGRVRTLVLVLTLLTALLAFPQVAEASSHTTKTSDPWNPCTMTHTYGSYYFYGSTLYQSTLSGTDSDCDWVYAGINNNNPASGDWSGPNYYASVSTGSATTYDSLICPDVGSCISHYDL